MLWLTFICDVYHNAYNRAQICKVCTKVKLCDSCNLKLQGDLLTLYNSLKDGGVQGRTPDANKLSHK